MIRGSGLPVCSGVAIGPVYLYRKGQATLPVSCGDPAVEGWNTCLQNNPALCLSGLESIRRSAERNRGAGGAARQASGEMQDNGQDRNPADDGRICRGHRRSCV